MDIIFATTAGALGGLLAALVKSYVDSRSKVDENLRDTRLRAYREIWQQTSILPKWPQATDVTYERLYAFSVWLRSWYFGTAPDGVDQTVPADRIPGGMFMSTEARKRYTSVQEGIGRAVGTKHGSSKAISAAEYKTILDACSELRTAMTRDLLSRRGAPFQW